jgi:SAM-dependent methyltransferase
MTVNRRFTPQKLAEIYQEPYFQGGEYVDYLGDKRAHQKTLEGHSRIVRRHVAPGGRILEVGCAYGFFLELIRDAYPGSVGVDVAGPAVEHARTLGLDVREGDLLTIPFSERFDAVCLWDTIEHLPDPVAVVGKSVSLLAPGGHLFLTTGDFGAWLARLQGRSWRQIHPPTHLFYFTRRALTELCADVGLDVVRMGTVTVHRRLHSVLRAVAHHRTAAGRLAVWLERHAPAAWQQCCFPLNLGDTLYLVARRA